MQRLLAERLRVLRARKGLSLTEAAELTGVTRDTISGLERGKRHPYSPTLSKLARGYGVPVEELMLLDAEAEESGLGVDVRPKVQAPPSSEPSVNDVVDEEERRNELRNIRKVLADALELLESWFEEYRRGRDGRKLADLTAVSILTHLGVAQYVSDEVGPMNDRESERIYLVGTRYEELIDDLLEELDSIPEVDADVEGFGVLIDIRERLRKSREAS